LRDGFLAIQAAAVAVNDQRIIIGISIDRQSAPDRHVCEKFIPCLGSVDLVTHNVLPGIGVFPPRSK
jgi:hypothetical protein